MPTNKILVLDKALSILSYFYSNSELSVKELEKLTGVNRTTIFKSLQSFVDWG
jgi:DNA-binding IclR family transcriptional regulator